MTPEILMSYILVGAHGVSIFGLIFFAGYLAKKIIDVANYEDQ